MTVRMAAATMSLAVLARPAGADGAADLARRLQGLRAPGPISAALRLDLALEHTSHGQSAKGEASITLDVDEDATGLRQRWDPALLRDADAEAHERDARSDRLTPIREAMKELDPSRVAHLLDQAGTLAGLTRGTPPEESAGTWEGHEARRLVYRFDPRMSWTEAYYARRREGKVTVWIAADGTPLASESVASFEGKTSRMFGRFKQTTTIRTRYAVEDDRLRVAERETDDLASHDDGGEVQHASSRFVVTRR
jgi:hypothetical protein